MEILTDNTDKSIIYELNHHVLYLKLMQYYFSNISQTSWEKNMKLMVVWKQSWLNILMLLLSLEI